MKHTKKDSKMSAVLKQPEWADKAYLDAEATLKDYFKDSYDYMTEATKEQYKKLAILYAPVFAYKKASDSRIRMMMQMFYQIHSKKDNSLNNVMDHSYNITEIGFLMGISRERVRQIESSALKKLKHPKVGRVLKSYIEE